MLGEAWARIRHLEHVLTAYRQSITLGYVNPDDTRMVPQTFEAATLVGRFQWLQYTMGYLARTKPRDDDQFVSLSDLAGASGTHQGGVIAGVRLAPRKSFWLEASALLVLDTFNTAFVNGEYTIEPVEDMSLTLAAQYTDQRSVGEALIGSFSTWNVGARVTADLLGAQLGVCFHATGDGAAIRTPYGGWPGYLAMINKDFDRAHERAWGVTVGYEFSRAGIPGLTALLALAQGTGAIDAATGKSAPDRREYDFEATWVPPTPWLRGLAFRVSVGLVDQEGTKGLLPDIRLSLNYELPVL